jgi:hypothetical protein
MTALGLGKRRNQYEKAKNEFSISFADTEAANEMFQALLEADALLETNIPIEDL